MLKTHDLSAIPTIKTGKIDIQFMFIK